MSRLFFFLWMMVMMVSLQINAYTQDVPLRGKVINSENELDLQAGANIADIILEQESILLETVIVTAQQREQQLLDVPITVSVIGAQMLENTHTRDLEQLSALVPGLNIRIQTPHRPTFVIRGVTSDEVNLTDQPRVSVYYNQVPTSRSSMAVGELYDLERVEVPKGPQGTLFGRGAYLGVINFITQKPKADFGGYVSVGLGNYNMREVEGVVNVPVLKNKLSLRAAGIYGYQDGYVKNLSGGNNLNGRNTLGGRFSATYTPVRDLKIDWLINYQKDDNPGTAFMSRRYPNSKGESDIFKYEASLDPGKTWFNKRDVLLSSLSIKYDITETGYLTAIASLVNNTVDHHYDGDGTVAPALDMSEMYDMKQLTAELRYNFSLTDKLGGLVGTSYWRESGDYSWGFDPDERYAVFPVWNIVKGYFPGFVSGIYPQLFLPLIAPDGTANRLEVFPGMFSGSAADVPLPSDHHEQINNGATSLAFDLFADATYQIMPQLSFTAGVRGTYESFEATRNVTNDAGMATSFGAEVTVKVALSRYLDVFGNYAYIHARFDDTDADGNPQEYAGNTGLIFGVPTFVPGAPRMFGGQVKFSF